MNETELRALVRDVPDFPRPGVLFKDLTPLLASGPALAQVVDDLTVPFVDRGITHVAGIEARGFILAVPVALRLGAGFVPARKAEKLPSEAAGVDFELEYGAERLEMHVDALGGGDRVLVVDDVLATGGTARATADLVARLGASVAGVAVIIELGSLGGRAKLDGLEVHSLLTY